MSRPFPILFISSTRIGDAVLSSGLIKRLLDEAPNARFTIAAGPLSAPLFRDTPQLESLIAMEKKKSSGHWFDLWAKVRGRRWGLVVDTRGSAISRFLFSKVRAIHRPSPDPVHKVVEAARLLKLETDPPAPHLYISPERQAEADALLGDGGPILAIGPGANWFGKTWPEERFAALAAQLLQTHPDLIGGRLVVVGSEADRPPAQALRPVVDRGHFKDFTGRLDLLTTAAVLKRARLYVGNDSGLMHMASAVGAPTLGLFGPSDDRLYGPWGPHGRALRGPRAFEAFKVIDPDLNQAIGHMNDLTVSAAAAAAADLLEATKGSLHLRPRI